LIRNKIRKREIFNYSQLSLGYLIWMRRSRWSNW